MRAKTNKRIIAMLITVVMVITLVPASVFAYELPVDAAQPYVVPVSPTTDLPDYQNQDRFTVTNSYEDVTGGPDILRVTVTETAAFGEHLSTNDGQKGANGNTAYHWFGLLVGNFNFDGDTAADTTYYVNGSGSAAAAAPTEAIAGTVYEGKGNTAFPLWLAPDKGSSMVNNERTITISSEASNPNGDLVINITFVPMQDSYYPTKVTSEGELNDAIAKGIENIILADSITITADTTIPAGIAFEVATGTTLIVNSGVALTANGILNNNGTISGAGTITVGAHGNFYNQGSTALATTVLADGMLANSGSFTVGGDITVSSGGYFDIKDGSTLYNFYPQDGAIYSKAITFKDEKNGNILTTNYTGLDGAVVNMLADPTMPGHKFVGWYMTNASNEDVKVDLSTYLFTDNTIVFAKWEAMSYDVTFNFNYEGAPANVVKSTWLYQGVAPVLTELPTPPVKDGYYLASWNTAKDGSGKDISEFNVNPDITNAFYAIEENMTFYAQWKKVDVEGTVERLEEDIKDVDTSTAEGQDIVKKAALDFVVNTMTAPETVRASEQAMNLVKEIDALLFEAFDKITLTHNAPTYEAGVAAKDKLPTNMPVKAEGLAVAFGLNYLGLSDVQADIDLNVTQFPSLKDGTLVLDIHPTLNGDDAPPLYSPVTLTIYLPKDFNAEKVNVKHIITEGGQTETFKEIPVMKTADGVKYFQITITSFSQFEITPIAAPTTDVPKTGDNSQAPLFAMLAIISMAGIAVAVSTKRNLSK